MMGFSPEMLAMLQGLGGMQGGQMGALGGMAGQLQGLPPDIGAILAGGGAEGPVKGSQPFPWEAAGTAALGAAGMPLAAQNRRGMAELAASPRGGLPVAGGPGRGLQAPPFRLAR